MSQTKMALAAYRNLYRATRIAFRDDARMLVAARERIRDGFREKANVPVTDPSVDQAIKHAQEVATFLRTNLVQGKKEADGVYKLRIHEETERGDNDTIKVGNGLTVKIDGKKCCSDA